MLDSSSVAAGHYCTGAGPTFRTFQISFGPDNDSLNITHPVWQPEGHLGKLGAFPCYDPRKAHLDRISPLQQNGEIATDRAPEWDSAGAISSTAASRI